MALRDEVIRRIAQLPDSALSDVARFLNMDINDGTDAYERAKRRALDHMHHGVPLHLTDAPIPRE